jgi:streptogramin lyase
MAYELQATLTTDIFPEFVLFSNGSIWVGTTTAVWRVDPVALTVTLIYIGACRTNLVEDQYGYIWFMDVPATLQRIDPSNNSITTVTVVSGQSTHNRLSLALGELWVTVTNPPNSVDVYRVDPSTYVATYSFTTTGISGSITGANSFFVEQNGYIWFSRTGFAGHFVGQLDPATNTVVSNTLISASFASYFHAGIAEYGYLWATSTSGMMRFNTSSLAFAFDGGSSSQALVDYNGSLYTSDLSNVYKYDVNTLTTTTIIASVPVAIGDFRFDNAKNVFVAGILGGGGRTLKYVIPAVGWVRGHAWG